MLRGLLAAFAGLASIAILVPTAAEAGGRRSSDVSITFSSGGYYGHGYKRDHWRHHHRQYVRRSQRVVYVAPPPRVIYAPPPTIVYADPPPVIAPAPVYAPPVAMQRVPGGPVALAQPYCREYNTTTIVNGQRVNTYGTACQQPDGAWQIVD